MHLDGSTIMAGQSFNAYQANGGCATVARECSAAGHYVVSMLIKQMGVAQRPQLLVDLPNRRLVSMLIKQMGVAQP